MGEIQNRKETTSEEIIAAFDRERDEAHELRRRYAQQIRESRRYDRSVHIERRRKPR